jgi:hypothetical protein
MMLADDAFAKGSHGCKKKILFLENQVPDGFYLLLAWLELVEMEFKAGLDNAFLRLYRRILCLLNQPL